MFKKRRHSVSQSLTIQTSCRMQLYDTWTQVKLPLHFSHPRCFWWLQQWKEESIIVEKFESFIFFPERWKLLQDSTFHDRLGYFYRLAQKPFFFSFFFLRPDVTLSLWSTKKERRKWFIIRLHLFLVDCTLLPTFLTKNKETRADDAIILQYLTDAANQQPIS